MLGDGQEPEVPSYYVLGKNIRDANSLLGALRMTPVDIAIVSNVLDYDFAQSVFSAVILVSPGRERETREGLGRRVVIFGEAEYIDAIYPDGRRENLIPRA